MSSSIQSVFTLMGCLLFVALFLPAGSGELTGFSGAVGHISSVGLPFPMVGAAHALAVEIVERLALLAGFGTRIAVLVLAAFTRVAHGAGAFSLDACNGQ